MRNIFITGGTGFLGQALIQNFLENKKLNIYVLVRAKSDQEAIVRRKTLITPYFTRPLRPSILKRVHFIRGDIEKDKVGLSKKVLCELKTQVDTIYHSAAILDFKRDMKFMRQVNVKGTENLLDLALNWKKSGVLKNVNHISTSYISGTYQEGFFEDQLDVGQKFHNAYEQTKFEAEKAVYRFRKKGLSVDIYRPGLIVDSLPLNRTTPSMLVKLLSFCAVQMTDRIPANKDAGMNLIQVDTAARSIYMISSFIDKSPNKTYHITSPNLIKIEDLLKISADIFRFKKPLFVSEKDFQKERLNVIQRSMIKAFKPYLNQHTVFDNTRALNILKKCGSKIPMMTKNTLREIFKKYVYR
ncbi:MAG: SDR family oxidoreductase [Candidatus Omnitrophota bacterium]